MMSRIESYGVSQRASSPTKCAAGALLLGSGTALVEVDLLMLELQLRDIDVRFIMVELNADLEALRVKRGELADDGLAGEAALVWW